MSIDPHGRFGPLGTYGAYGRVGSAINLIVCAGMVVVGTVVMFVQGFAAGLPVWFAVLWWAVGATLTWRFALIFRSVRRREREKSESERTEQEPTASAHDSSSST